MDAVSSTLEWQISDAPVDYLAALASMQARVSGIRDGAEAELVWLLEHPALYTAGTSATAEGLIDPDRLPTYRAGRGGQWTYHGPGQRVGYVLLDLNRAHGPVPARDVRRFVEGLEAWLITTLDRFGVRGERRAGRIGIWVADRRAGTEAKVAAIGVRVSRWVTWHGVSLNVAPDLEHFGGIVPCGITEHGVTSLAALGVAVTTATVDAALREAWRAVFGR